MHRIKSWKLFSTAIPVLSLSVFSLNLMPTIASTAVAKPTPVTRTNLVAQSVTCSVVNIRSGQLALRFSPNGSSRAGLDNGDTVALLRNGSGVWSYVRVLSGPNSAVNGLEGWVNSDYLSCGESSEASAAPSISCDVVNIRSGQLALRFTPDGKSRAGLNNGNIVTPLRDGPGVWRYVRVIQGPNRAVTGLEGWVNSNYLSCYD